MLSGNYSYGNVQYGQMQYENKNAFQNSTAPFISDGFLQTNNGSITQTHMPGRTILRENLSDLASNVYLESSVGSQLHQSKQVGGLKPNGTKTYAKHYIAQQPCHSVT